MADEKSNSTDEKQSSGKKALNSYAYYTSMGFQMIAVIGVFAFIGYKIDEGQASKTPLFTAFFSLAGVFISLYLVIRSVKKNKS
ncbi:AtpZ/AtpI family protein [Arcticibacter tournemirensis]